MVSEKIGPIIQVALTAHHTPIMMSCDGILWINIRNRLFREFTYPLS